MCGSLMPRPLGDLVDVDPALARRFGWLDTLGLDSAYDYDPVWAKAQELGFAGMFHGGLGHMPSGSFTAVTNYTFNHIGSFAQRLHSLCKSLFMGDLAWPDVTRRISDRRTVSLADQLYRASGSVGANIAEGYSRGTGKAASASTNTAWGLREKHATGTTRPVTSSASRSSTTAANCWQRSFASCSP